MGDALAAGPLPPDASTRARAARAVLLAGVGAWGEAEPWGDDGGTDSRDPSARALSVWARALVMAGRGEPAAAAAKLREAEAELGDGVRSILRDALRLERVELTLSMGSPAPEDLAWLRSRPESELPVLEGWAALLGAQARLEHAPASSVRPDLERLAERADRHGWPRLQARALLVAARAAVADGNIQAARVRRATAVEVLEGQAVALPAELRGAFWQVPAHRAGQELLARANDPEPSFHRPGLEARTARLLDILERLAAEWDGERLLERIVDNAVELTGAERGLLLRVDEEGRLEARPRFVRARGAAVTDGASVEFSRSIAEAVLIDGDPIVASDAAGDHRLAEYASVHRLQLQSVACVPIGNRDGIEGVLYLEHRFRRGRFGDTDLSLLLALAHQAAIALQKARLLAENERRRRELEDTNRELARAKAELEHVLVARTAQLEETKQELDRVRGKAAPDYARHGMVGRSEALRRVFAVIDRVRETNVPVVVRGESGTGKELVARAVHYAGARADGPFVVVNCAAVPEALLESELFGHVRGAFTGADRDRRGVMTRASGGTLFLDEVGDMSPKMQVKLLRVLVDGKVRPVGGEQEHPVDVRIVAATQRPLQELVKEGRFREDLFYRLDVVEIRVPPLRERLEDVPLLADHFLRQLAERDGTGPRRLTREALDRLASHSWPGNVRELEHVLLNACVLAESDVIDADGLALQSREATEVVAPTRRRAASEPPGGFAESADDFRDLERRRILAALQEQGWNRAGAARALGMARRTFYRRLKEYDIQ